MAEPTAAASSRRLGAALEGFDPLAELGEAEAVRDIYIRARSDARRGGKRPRAASFGGQASAGRASEFAVPGGFRRQFLGRQNAASRTNSPETKVDMSAASPLLPPAASLPGAAAAAASTSSTPTTHGRSSFLATFLLQYYDDIRTLADAQAMTHEDLSFLSPGVPRRSLFLRRGQTRQLLQGPSGLVMLDEPGPGASSSSIPDFAVLAGTQRTVFTILKSFLGTAILFIPRGMFTAGLVAGCVTLALAGLVSTWAMALLIRTRRHLEVTTGRPVFGYGETALLVLGRGGKLAVDGSILLSQIGFGCVYFSFWATVFAEVTAGYSVFASWSRLEFGLICLLFAVPLVWIRHLKYLGAGNLLSDIAIAFSLVYIVSHAATLLSRGDAEHEWSCTAAGGGGGGGNLTSSSYTAAPGACFWINPQQFLMFAGTSVYSFEGIAMVLPIQSSMKRPQDMERLLSFSMAFICVVLVCFGGFCFYVFGAKTKNVVTSNLPAASPLTKAVQWAYLFVAIITVPMCTFPAIRIWERWLFDKQRRSGRRTAACVFCLLVGVYGGKQLDHLVALIGGLFSTPLALVFPPLLHWQAGVNRGACSRASDAALCVFGAGAGILATFTAIYSW